MKCETCNKEYSADCEYNQGRCPHHPPLINVQPKDTSKGHFYVSLVKSALRISACIRLLRGDLFTAGILFILAEILGVVEELV